MERKKVRQRQHSCTGDDTCKHPLHKPIFAKNSTAVTVSNPNGAGAPTVLSEETFNTIRDIILQEGLNLDHISARLGVAQSTLRTWKSTNYKGYADKVLTYELERQLKTALKNHQEDLDLPIEAGIEDPRLLALRQKATQFTLETLGKELFSKEQKTPLDQVEQGLNIQRLLQEIANDSKHEQDSKASLDAVQGRERGSTDADTEAIRDIRADILQALQSGKS